jgi:hypothetical protein
VRDVLEALSSCLQEQHALLQRLEAAAAAALDDGGADCGAALVGRREQLSVVLEKLQVGWMGSSAAAGLLTDAA